MKPTLILAALLAASAHAQAEPVPPRACMPSPANTVPQTVAQMERERLAARSKGPQAEAEVLFAYAVQKAAGREPTYAVELAAQANALWRAMPPTATLATALQRAAFKLEGPVACPLSVPLLRTALAISEQASGPEQAETVAVLAELVRVENAQRETKVLEQDGARLMAAWSKHSDPADKATAPLYRKMIDLYYRQQQYALAEPLALRNLHNGEQAYGKDAPQLIDRLDDIAIVYYGQLRYNEGEALSRRARDIALKHQPASLRAQPDLQQQLDVQMTQLFNSGDVKNAIAVGKQELAQLEQTLAGKEQALHQAIEAREAAAGAAQMEKLSVAATSARIDAERARSAIGNMRVRLAELYHHQDNYELAQSTYQQALIDFMEAQADPLEMAPAQSSLAMLYRAHGEYERALPLQQQAQAALLAAYGPQHPDVVESARELALLRQQH